MSYKNINDIPNDVKNEKKHLLILTKNLIDKYELSSKISVIENRKTDIYPMLDMYAKNYGKERVIEALKSGKEEDFLKSLLPICNSSSFDKKSDENDNIYSAKYADVIDMILVNVGDEITIKVNNGQFIYHK